MVNARYTVQNIGNTIISAAIQTIQLIQSAKSSYLVTNLVYVICKHGNDSQLAVEALKKHGIKAMDVIGGLDAWALEVDESFPRY